MCTICDSFNEGTLSFVFANPLESNLLSCLLLLFVRYYVADTDIKLMLLYDFKTEHTVFTVPCQALGRSACANLVCTC